MDGIFRVCKENTASRDVNIGRGFRRGRREKDCQAELGQGIETQYETAIA
jgi:hypothetical protein